MSEFQFCCYSLRSLPSDDLRARIDRTIAAVDEEIVACYSADPRHGGPRVWLAAPAGYAQRGRVEHQHRCDSAAARLEAALLGAGLI